MVILNQSLEKDGEGGAPRLMLGEGDANMQPSVAAAVLIIAEASCP